MTGLSIRTATGRDVEAILRLWREASAVPTVSDTPAALERLLAVDPEALVLAEFDSAVVGSVIVGWDGWRGSMYRLAVSPGLRRQGIATALVRKASGACVRAGPRGWR